MKYVIESNFLKGSNSTCLEYHSTTSNIPRIINFKLYILCVKLKYKKENKMKKQSEIDMEKSFLEMRSITRDKFLKKVHRLSLQNEQLEKDSRLAKYGQRFLLICLACLLIGTLFQMI